MKYVAAALAWALVVASPAQGEDAGLDERLAVLGALAGSCWEGRFEGSDLVDIRCIETILDGGHARDVHEVVGTGYRGETIYSWDPEAGRIAYAYYNVLGGIARGWLVAATDGLEGEGVYRGADGGSREIGFKLVLDGDRMVQSSFEGGRETAKIVFDRRHSDSFPQLFDHATRAK